MALDPGMGGSVYGGWDFDDSEDLLAMKTSTNTSKVGAISGGFSGSAAAKALTSPGTTVGMLSVEYDPEFWSILSLGGV